jgi:hypothetical protein
MNAPAKLDADLLDDLVAAADMLRNASALRRRAQAELDQAIAREHDAALRVRELRARQAA